MNDDDAPTPSNDRAGSRRVLLLCVLTVSVIVTVVFLPCLRNGFTTWDDDVYVTRNSLIKDLAWERVRDIFTTFELGNYHPLTLLSYALDYRLHALNPTGYHATNLALHTLNCLLVFWLIYMLSGKPWAALAVTLLFGVHPLRVETVAWISDRKDLLYAFFFLLSVIGYLQYRRSGKSAIYFISLAAYLFCLLSKAMGLALPFVLLLFDFLHYRKVDRKTILEKLPFLVLAVLFGVVALIARGSYDSVLREQSVPVLSRITLGGYRLVSYFLLRMLVPAGMSLLNPFYTDRSRFLPSPVLLGLSATALAGLACGILLSMRRTRKIAFGSLFILLTLAPVLVTVILGYSADRFTYIPAVGLSYLAAEALIWAWGERRTSAGWARIGLVAIWTGMFVLFAALTWRGCGIWKSGVTLWTDAVLEYPLVAAYHINLGNAYRGTGDIDKAIGALTRATELEPGASEPYLNRGTAYAVAGRYALAVADYDRAIEIKPSMAGAYGNRGIAFWRLGKIPEAIRDFDEAIRLRPNLVGPWISRGALRGRGGEYEGAIADLTVALRLDPYNFRALVNRGAVYSAAGNYDAAVADYTRAMSIDPSSAIPYAGRSRAFALKGENDRARLDIRKLQDMGVNEREGSLEHGGPLDDLTP